MFYQIQPDHYINLKDITYFYLAESEMYRNCIIIFFRGMKEFRSFRFNDSYTCRQSFNKLVAKIQTMNNHSIED